MTAIQPISTYRRELLTMSTEWTNPSVVRISVAGEVDASNSADLRDYVFQRAANCQHLIVDLSGVRFLSSAGLSALRTIDVRCGRAEVTWTLIGGSEVSRLLDICDPDRALPFEPS